MTILTKKRIIWTAAGILVLGLISGGIVARASKKSPASEPKDAPLVLELSGADLARVEAIGLQPRLRVSGSLQPLRQAVVKARVAGEITSLASREGDVVHLGQVLAQVDTAELETRLAERVGNLESARAQRELAEKNRANNQALLKQGFISQNAYDNAASVHAANRGTELAWEAQVQLARNALRDAVVLAPLAGEVAKRHVQVGERVALDAPLYTVVDLAELELQAPVPAVDVPQLKPGMLVQLTIDGFGQEQFQGRVTRINPATEPGTRSILVYVSLNNPGRRLKAGMFAAGEIALATNRPVPTLPAAAVRTEGGENFAWVIEGDKLARRVLETGGRDEVNGRVEILTALAPEARVLAGRFDHLKEGLSVRVKEAVAAAPSKS